MPSPRAKLNSADSSAFSRVPHFAHELATLPFTHWHTYPKSPKMNAHCERFNRTVQDECIDYHYDLLFLDDLTDFNLELLHYLAWYNLERPQFSLTTPIPGRKTPHLLSPAQCLQQNHRCNRY
jgi:transposase InsO family protein